MPSKSYKVFSFIYALGTLYLALSLVLDWLWTADGFYGLNGIFLVIFILLFPFLTVCAIESWRSRAQRNFLQKFLVWGPILLLFLALVIGVLMLAAAVLLNKIG